MSLYNMKPWILILSGIVLAIVLITWIYLFFAGDDARADLFNALNFGDTSGENIPFEDFFDTEEETEGELALLRQLSLRRIIGYTPYEATASSTAHVYFTEAGTGHIYNIDTTSGEESRISNITVATANRSALSTDGRFAVIASVENQSTLTIITLPHGSTTLDSFTIAADAFSFSLTPSNILLYAEYDNSSVVAYAYDLEKKTQTKLFTLPFRDATIVWGSEAISTHYAYPRTTSQLEGYLYQIKNGTMSRLPISGYGLSALSDGVNTIFTKRAGEVYESSVYEHDSRTITSLSSPFLPEKCALKERDLLCGFATIGYDNNSPDTWYSGEVSYNDGLWYTNLETEESFLVLNPEVESGRTVDMKNIIIQNDNKAAFFVNKTDLSLWIYEGDFMSNSRDN